MQFEQAVRDHKAEYKARGFTSWGQFVARLFCQLGHAHTLRGICGGLASCEGKLKHLGVPKKNNLDSRNIIEAKERRMNTRDSVPTSWTAF